MSFRRLAAALVGPATLVLGTPSAGLAAVATLAVDASVLETYDDNVDRVAAGKRDDWITTVRVGATVSAATIRSRGFLRYGLGVEFFASDTEEQGQLTHDGAVAVQHERSARLTLRAADSIRVSETQEAHATQALPGPEPEPGPALPEAPPAVEPGTQPTGRGRRLDNTIALAADYAHDAFTAFGVNYGLRSTRFDAPDRADTDTHRAGASARWQVDPNDNLGVAYATSWWQTSEGDHRLFHEVAGTWRHAFSPDFSASVAAGLTWDDEGDVEAGLVGDTAVEGRFRRTRVRASYRGRYRTSLVDGNPVRSDLVSLGVARELSRRVSGEAGVAYARSEPLEQDTGVTHTVSAAARLGARLTRHLEAHAAYVFERNDAPALEATSYTNNRVTVSLSVLFPVTRSRHF